MGVDSMLIRRYVPLLTSFVILTAVATTAVQQAAASDGRTLTRLPSDPTLAVYVGLRGTWTHGSFTNQFSEIEAPMAEFGPDEQVSDELDVWSKRQINDPQPPPGWHFFHGNDARNMRLSVDVRDAQRRLKDVVITDRDTRAVIGTVRAEYGGSRISGARLIQPTAKHFTLEVRAKDTGATLCRLGVDSPETDDVVVCTLIYGFNANLGREHACPIVGPEGPWGDPMNLAGKVSTPSPDYQICIGGYRYTHDAGGPGQKSPLALRDKALLRDVRWDPRGFSLTAMEVVHGDVLTSLRESYAAGKSIMPSWAPPPFSEGIPHWRVNLQAAIHSVVCYPYRGRPMYKDQIAEELQARMEASRGIGLGTTTPSAEVAAGMNRSLTLAEKARWRVSEAIPIGDLWGYRAKLAEPPFAEPLAGLTTPVTFKLSADRTPPDDKPGLIGGTAKLAIVRAWTDPPPPPALTDSHTLVFPSEGPNKGVCTISLAKGFLYKVTTLTTDPPRYVLGHGASELGLGVPGNTESTVLARLATAQIVVKTVSGEQPVPATVQLRDAAGAVLQQVETARDSAGNYSYAWGAMAPGIYSFRAKPHDGPDTAYGEWESWQASPSTIPMTMTLNVKRL